MEEILLFVSVSGFVVLYLEIRELRGKLNKLLERQDLR